MLTLADSLRVESFTLFRDVVWRAGSERVRRYTSRFYALPDAPRLARDESGAPAFDFVWYRTPPDDAAAPPQAGGIVTLTVELGPTSEEKARLAAAVVAALPAEDLAAAEIVTVPFRSGTVSLTFAGEAAGEFAGQVAGSGPARLAGSERATFVIDLTRDGAALLHGSLEKDLELFQASYELVFEHHLDDVTLHVWCDVRRAHEAAAARKAAGPLAPGALRESLVADRLAGVEITTERPIDPEEQAALEKLGEEILEAALASALLDEGDNEAETLLNHTFTQSYPAEARVVRSDLLHPGTLAELGDRVRQIDLDGGFFKVLEVQVHCTVDFAEGPIDTVKATIDYDATGPSGRVQRSGELLFRAGSPTVQTFRTDLASPEQTAYRYEVEVWYTGSPEPLRLAFPSTDSTAIVLDLDRLGVLRVKVGLRDVPLERVRAAVVDLEYPPLGLTHRMLLDGENPAGLWQVAVRETPQPCRYRVAWLAADGRRVEEDWRTSASSAIALDAPASLGATARVQLVSAGDFAGLAQIVVDLETTVDSATHTAQLAFTHPGETQLWEPPLGADRAGFRYRALFTLVETSGAVRQLDWTDEDGPVLVVRDPLRFEVRAVPRLLDLGGTLSLALLTLEALESDERATLVLRRPDEEAVWSFRLATPERHRYRWQLTLIPKQGARTTTPWQEGESGVLVLRPSEE